MKYATRKSGVLLALLLGSPVALFAEEETAIICRNVADPGLAVPAEVYDEAYREYLEYGEVLENEDVVCEVAIVYKTGCPCEGFAISTAEWSSEFPTHTCEVVSTRGMGNSPVILHTSSSPYLALNVRPFSHCIVGDPVTAEYEATPNIYAGDPPMTDAEFAACNKSLRDIAKEDDVKCEKVAPP